jgi:hypothetical protein
MGVYPTLETLQDVRELAKSLMPITKPNEMTSILNTYHNTLLRVQHEQDKDPSDSQTVSP